MRLTRFALLAALAPIALGIPSLAQRFYPLGSAQVIIDTDGSVLVAGVDPQTTRDVQLALGTSGVEIGASPATVLVDRDGIDWTWEQDRIVGRRLGDVVHERSLARPMGRPHAVEDASGTRWFTFDREIQAFNGREWSRHSAPLTDTPAPDSAAFPLGRFLVFGRADFLDTHGGPLIVRASSAHEFESSPPDDWREKQANRKPLNEGHRLITVGRGVLLRVNDRSHALRAALVEEAFDPTYVDRSGRLWRHQLSWPTAHESIQSLAFLEGDQSVTLVDSSTKKPAAVRHFFGVDARGLAYFKLMGGSTFALDLSAQSDSTANFAWLWTSVEAWTPDREQEALQLVTSAIRDEQPERAIEAAQRMRGIAQKSRDALSDPSLWQAICVPLEEAAGRRNQPPRQALARAAQLVGLGDVMRREVLAASAALALDESSQRFPRACGLAPLAESAGELDIALDTYRLCMELAAERGVVQTSLALDASRCAARMRRSDTAIEWASSPLKKAVLSSSAHRSPNKALEGPS